jgi:hypothetical protein
MAVDVLFSELMSVFAVSLLRVGRCGRGASPVVLGLRHGFEVCWILAESDPAQVIYV